MIRLREKGFPKISVAVLIFIIGICYISVLIPGTGNMEMDPDAIDKAPSMAHIFGTDTLGRDVLAMVLSGGRLSLYIGVLASLLATLIACVYGTVSGLSRRAADSALMRFTDMLLSLPSILLILFLQAVLGEATPTSIAFVIGVTSWMPMAKIVRAEVRQTARSGYILAARTMGASGLWIFRRHLVPNFIPEIRFMIIINIGAAISQESTLSFLGLGLPMTDVSWGSLMSQAEQVVLSDSWWFLLIPGTILVITLFCINEIAEYVRLNTGKNYNNL